MIAKAQSDDSGQESMLARLRGRVLWATPVTLLLAYLATWAILLWPEPDKLVVQTDFVSTITGAKIISAGDGQHLYDLSAQLAAQKAIRTPYMGDEGDQLLPYIHPPFEAVLMAPFVGLPYWLQYFLWVGLLALALFCSLRLLWHELPLPAHGHAGLAFALASISYGPVFRAFRLGQSSPLILLGLCGVYVAARKRNDGLAGLYLLLVALKPQMLPLVLLALLAMGRWRSVAWFGGLFSAISLAVMPVLGAQWPLRYLDVLLGVANWSDVNGVHPDVMHNWRGLATDAVGWAAPWLVTPLYLLFIAATLGMLGFVWWRVRGAAKTRSEPTATPLRNDNPGAGLWPAFDMLWALVGLSAVLISPHLNPHDLTLLIFPAWIICVYVVNGRPLAVPANWWLLLLSAHYLLLSVGLSVLGNVPTVLLSVPLLAVALAWLAMEGLKAAGSPIFGKGLSISPQ